MRDVDALITVRAPLRRDGEARRWYADGAATCIVLTRRGRLLEPHPTFGPTSYRVLALNATLADAHALARVHEMRHHRLLPPAHAPDRAG